MNDHPSVGDVRREEKRAKQENPPTATTSSSTPIEGLHDAPDNTPNPTEKRPGD